MKRIIMQRRPLIFIIFTAAMFLSNFYQTAMAVISTSLAGDLGLTAAQLGLMSSVFFATFAAVQIPLGIGLDRWGPRWVTSGMMSIGGVGSLLFAAAPSLAWLTVGRGMMGIGMASILMGGMKTLSQWYPPARFATMTGLLVGIASFGTLFAATPLAWLNAQVGWRAVFASMGILTLLVSLVIVVFGRNSPPDVEWVRPAQKQGGIGQVLRDKRFWRMVPIALFGVGTGAGFQGLWAGPYLFDSYSLSEIVVGNFILLIGIGGTFGSFSSGWLADRFELPRIVLLANIGFVLVLIVLALHPALLIVGGAYMLFGFAAAFNILVLAHSRSLFPDEITGQALTAINLSMFVGIFLVQWLAGVVIEQFPLSATAAYPPQAYTTVLGLLVVCNLFAIGMYSSLAKRA